MEKKILVVDDDPTIRTAFEERFRLEGYEVITATDGKSGVEKAKEEIPDLVVLDIVMPEMDGIEACRLLKSDSRYRHIPVIIITASLQAAAERLSKEVGADVYIQKSPDFTDLVHAVKRFV